MSDSKKSGIIGSDNSAWALTCYLSEQGWNVSMLVRNEEKVRQMPDSICGEGKIIGFFNLDRVTCDAKEFMSSVSTVFVATVTTAYIDVMQRILPYLTDRSRKGCRRED